jgi:hypothetical protein
VRVRQLSAALVATALAVTGLSACTSKVGAAAIIDGHRISQRQVDRYLVAGGPAPSAAANIATQGPEAAPKYNVVSFLVQQAVFTRVLQDTGGVPSAATLAGYHDAALTNLLGSAVTGSAFDAGVDSESKAQGYSPRFRALLINAIELEWAVAVRVKASGVADLSKVVAKQRITVQVSGQYGRWDATNLQLTKVSGAVPSFIKQPSTAASTTAAPSS